MSFLLTRGIECRSICKYFLKKGLLTRVFDSNFMRVSDDYKLLELSEALRTV